MKPELISTPEAKASPSLDDRDEPNQRFSIPGFRAVITLRSAAVGKWLNCSKPARVK